MVYGTVPLYSSSRDPYFVAFWHRYFRDRCLVAEAGRGVVDGETGERGTLPLSPIRCLHGSIGHYQMSLALLRCFCPALCDVLFSLLCKYWLQSSETGDASGKILPMLYARIIQSAAKGGGTEDRGESVQSLQSFLDRLGERAVQVELYRTPYLRNSRSAMELVGVELHAA